MSVLTSAAGILACLDQNNEHSTTNNKHDNNNVADVEKQVSLKMKSVALKQLNRIVDEFQPEIAHSISKIEILYEDTNFIDRKLAALLASKVYYHLEQFDEALTYALGAEELFDVSQHKDSLYVETIISQCIDKYIQIQQQQSYDKELDSRIINIVERMFEQCYLDHNYKQALGIAIDAQRIDKVQEALTISKEPETIRNMLSYCLDLCKQHIGIRRFRMQVLRELVSVYETLIEEGDSKKKEEDVLVVVKPEFFEDHTKICQCLLFLDDAETLASILDNLLSKDCKKSTLTAFQIAFDLCESQNHPFLRRTIDSLKLNIDYENISAESSEVAADTKQKEEAEQSATMNSANTNDKVAEKGDESEKKPLLSSQNDNAENIDKQSSTKELVPELTEHQKKLQLLGKILSGQKLLDLQIQFLYSHNKVDQQVFTRLLDKLDKRNSVTHCATVVALSYAQCGTTYDIFLRRNLDQFSRATNQAKFTASACFGVIHKGHYRESMKLLSSYLPKQQGQKNSPYQEGGALYALGLIHSMYGDHKIEYLLDALRNSFSNEIVCHGACLGIGLTAMSSGRRDIYNLLKDSLFHDNAVAGEAAGLAMGLILLGSGSREAVDDMLSYAHETKHEKIVRGLSLGLALLVYSLEEEGDFLIQQMISDKSSSQNIIRYGGCFALAMAYVATGNNSAIERLLHIAVSDVSDDVRRAALMALGFVMCSNSARLPDLVKLLVESYNPHSRYGAAMALGIGCSGTGLSSAIDLLMPLLKDRVDFVRQAAMISLSMIMLQQNSTETSRQTEFHQHLTTLNETKSGDTLTKTGAIIATGLMYLGGLNSTISLTLPETNYKRMSSIVGMMIFLQHQFWFPYYHCLSLAITPTLALGLNINLEIPKYFRMRCDAPKKLFDYLPTVKAKILDKKKKAGVAELSITAKVKARRQRKLLMRSKSDSSALEASESKVVEKSDTNLNVMDTKDDKLEKKDKNKPESKKNERKSLKIDQEGDIKMNDEQVIDLNKTGKEEIQEAKEVDLTQLSEAEFADKIVEDSKKGGVGKNNASVGKVWSVLSNPCRVTPHQRCFVRKILGQRYVPITNKLAGVIMLDDLRSGEEEFLVESLGSSKLSKKDTSSKASSSLNNDKNSEGDKKSDGKREEDGKKDDKNSNEPSPPKPFQYSG